MKAYSTEFGVTIKPTLTLGKWKVTGEVHGRKKKGYLIQPFYEVSIGIEPSFDQALNVLLNAK